MKLLRTSTGAQLYDAIAMARPGASQITPLDGELGGLVAYATIIELSGRPRWRTSTPPSSTAGSPRISAARSWA